ncbi:phage scaffolding protein [Bacillus sp. FSL K6-3431]|uniref:phage scaffolding protein n=1 Tax=Bacillus sp. FSL K6-3431 TaxID=2921500 RepID=UPI0030FA0715
MNREFLKGLGLTDEQIDKAMIEHGKTVNKTKEDLTSAQSERDSLKVQLTERDTQLETLKTKAAGNEDLTAEIERLKGENSTATAELQAKLDKQAFDFSLEKSLTAAKVRNPKAVKALLDTEKIKLDGEKLLNLDDQLEALKASDAYLFEEEQQQGGKPSFTTGQHQTGGGIATGDFAKMTYSERLKLKQENPTQYDSLVGN